MQLTGVAKPSDCLRMLASSAAVLFLLLGLAQQTAASTATTSTSDVGAADGTQPPTPAATNLTTDLASGSSSSPSEVCLEEAEACMEGEACQTCYSDLSGLMENLDEEHTECQSNLIEADDTSVCSILGAQFCCKNDLSQHDCLGEDTLAAAYWGCVFEHYACVVDDVPCFDAVGRDDDGHGSFVDDTGTFRTDDDVIGGVSTANGAAGMFGGGDRGGWPAASTLGAGRGCALGLAVAAGGALL